MAAYLSPVGNDNFVDSNGNPLSGGKIATYLAGSTTPAATYTSNTGLTPQSNPIILNTRGVAANPIWLQGGSSYKLVVLDVNDVVLQTIDNVTGINDPANLTTQDEWVALGITPTYLSATTFSVPGDQTPTLQINRRLKTANSGGTIYSRISNSAFGAGITTVTVVNDSGTLDSGLSSVSYGLLSVTNPSIPETTLGKALRVVADAETARTALGFTVTGSAPAYAVRAFVRFNGSGGAVISGSGNVTSVTRNSLGDYTVNITTALPSANYVASISHEGLSIPRITSQTTTAFRFTLRTTAGAVTDDTDVQVTIVG